MTKKKASKRVAKKTTRKTTGRKVSKKGSSAGFSAEERAAMKERARELKAQRRGKDYDGEAEVLAKIAEMPEPDRVMATRLHALVRATVPSLQPRTWYGMPAYSKAGKVLFFFQGAARFKSRYATFGFSDEAHLDDGGMWPTGYALTKLTPEVEAAIVALLEKAVS